ncbi:MAG: hypothetical protein IJ325_03300 [Clostridia bacterium]|nr:hypothetical protein [Clostridia bacterium]
MKINQYFNTPVPVSAENAPAVCVGVNFSAKDYEKPVMRFIVKRDLRIRIVSLTLTYRFSDLPLGEADENTPFQQFVCSKEEMNEQEFLVFRGNYQGNTIPENCTAVVLSVTLENGETIAYTAEEYRDPPCLAVKTEDITTISPALDEFFRFRAAERRAGQENQKAAVNSLIAKAAAVLNEETALQNFQRYRKNRIVKRRTIETIAAVLVAIVLICGVVLIRNMNRTEESPLQAAVSALLADGRYGDAYKTVQEAGDTEILQSVCRTAAEHFQHIKDYKTAYLYASAAPEPFDKEIIDTFITLLLSQNRQEEAYQFLLELPQYTDAMQKVCVSAVEAFLNRQEYDKAYFYAINAPESLESYVMQQSSGQIITDGQVSDEIWDSLGETDDPEKVDEMALWAADSLNKSKSFAEAASVAFRINNAEKRSAILETICVSGMKEYLQTSDLNKAVKLYTDCSAGMKEEAMTNTVRQMIEYANSIQNAAGILYFSHMLSEDTSALVISPGDYSIKKSGIVWQYMTTEQKRTYHARSIDLYKEAYRIENGTVENITDAVSVAASEQMAVALLKNGTVKALSGSGRNTMPALPADTDIVSVDVGQKHVVLLHTDGTVTAVGSNDKDQCNTTGWTDVTKVVSGAYFTAALRSDGTLYACGSNISGQCNVDGITGVMDIAACDDTLVLHMSDNTLKLVGEISMGLKAAEDFDDIVRVRAGGNTILAETDRGTYLLAHASYNASAGFVLTWKNMEDFAAGFLCAGCIDQNGTMQITGDGSVIVHDGYTPGVQ